MGKKLYGHVSKDNLQYEWKSEPGACKVCQVMDGTIYESANDIPDRPHPNCKCWIDVQEKDNDENLTDPFEIRKEIYKDKKRSELELGKLSGDAKSLEEEVDEYLRQIESKENELGDFEREIVNILLEPNEKQKLGDIKEQLDFAKYKGQNAKQKISTLKKDIEKSTGKIEEISKLEFEIIRLKQTVEDLIVKYTDKWFANIVGEIYSKIYNMPEALALYKIGSPEKHRYESYIRKNGRMYDSVTELNNIQLIKDFSNRLQQEIGKQDAPIFVLNPDSSMSKAITKSSELQLFVIENIRQLFNGHTVYNEKIIFSDGDLYNALHGAVIREAKIDVNGNLNIQILDIWNFNKNRPSVRGRLGEKYQNKGELTNFGILVLIKIPKQQWEKILK